MVAASRSVWRALSCCSGFGGEENPRFWDAVLHGCKRDAGSGFTEATRVGFHDEKASPSPIRLRCLIHGMVARDEGNVERVCMWISDVCRSLFELPSAAEKQPLSQEYEDTLTRLQPCIDQRQFESEPIAVHLELEAWKQGKGPICQSRDTGDNVVHSGRDRSS